MYCTGLRILYNLYQWNDFTTLVLTRKKLTFACLLPTGDAWSFICSQMMKPSVFNRNSQLTWSSLIQRKTVSSLWAFEKTVYYPVDQENKLGIALLTELNLRINIVSNVTVLWMQIVKWTGLSTNIFSSFHRIYDESILSSLLSHFSCSFGFFYSFCLSTLISPFIICSLR